MDSRPTYREFAASIWRAWSQRMSGPFQVAFAIIFGFIFLIAGAVSVAVHSIEGIISTGFLALAALHVSSYGVWADERRKVVTLQDHLVPRLHCEFSDSIPGCVRPNTAITIEITSGSRIFRRVISGTYYRLQVSVLGGETIHKCTGNITGIERNSRGWVDGENLLLTFAPAESADSTQRDLRAGEIVYLDLLFIGDDNNPLLVTKDFKGPSSVKWDTMFANPGEYLFHIVVLTASSVSVKQNILFKWTGDRSTSQLKAV